MKRGAITQMLFTGLLAAALASQLGSGCSTKDAPLSSPEGSFDRTDIPRQATVVRSGQGELSYIPKQGGEVYLYDAVDRVVLDIRTVGAGQKYVVIPDENKVLLNGHRVYDGDLKRRHDHRIYFFPHQRHDDGSSNNDGQDDRDRIPPNATRVAEGKGELTYRARSDGRAYLYDEDADRLIWGRDLRRDQLLKVEPLEDLISVDGKKVHEGDLKKDHSHRIYFERR